MKDLSLREFKRFREFNLFMVNWRLKELKAINALIHCSSHHKDTVVALQSCLVDRSGECSNSQKEKSDTVLNENTIIKTLNVNTPKGSLLKGNTHLQSILLWL